MIHLLKASSKPVGSAYKRRLISIGATPFEFHSQANEAQVQARAEVPQSKVKGEKPLQEEVKDPPGNRSNSAQAEEMAVDSIEIREANHQAAASSSDGFKNVQEQLRKTSRNRTKTHQQ